MPLLSEWPAEHLNRGWDFENGITESQEQHAVGTRVPTRPGSMQNLGFVGDAHGRLATVRAPRRRVMSARTAENEHRRIMSQINAA